MSEHMQRSTIKVVLRHVIGGFRRYAHVRVQALVKKNIFHLKNMHFAVVNMTFSMFLQFRSLQFHALVAVNCEKKFERHKYEFCRRRS